MSYLQAWNENRYRLGLPPLRLNPVTEQYEVEDPEEDRHVDQ